MVLVETEAPPRKLPIKPSKEHWVALVVYIAIVAFVASVSPTNLIFDLFIQALLSFILLQTLMLVRETAYCKLLVRAAFQIWFAIMCGIWPLAFGKLIRDM